MSTRVCLFLHGLEAFHVLTQCVVALFERVASNLSLRTVFILVSLCSSYRFWC